MKELEKTKRISIAAVLSILIIVIGLLNYRRPSHLYNQNTSSTLSKLLEADYLVSPEGLDSSNFVVIDVRNSYEYEKGHLPEAINIYAPELLSPENTDILKGATKDDRTLLLYGNDPNEALPAFMMLCQLGIGPVKILEAKNYFDRDQLKTVYFQVEKNAPDVKTFIQSSVKRASESQKASVKKPVTPKKVLPAKKKKKKMPEGGC